MAAERMATIRKPFSRWGLRHHKDGEDEVVGGDAGAGAGLGQGDLERMALVKNPEHRADQQEDEEEGKDNNGAQDEGFAAVGDGLQASTLDDQLFGPWKITSPCRQ
jgi:hypothetical protein